MSSSMRASSQVPKLDLSKHKKKLSKFHKNATDIQKELKSPITREFLDNLEKDIKQKREREDDSINLSKALDDVMLLGGPTPSSKGGSTRKKRQLIGAQDLDESLQFYEK